MKTKGLTYTEVIEYAKQHYNRGGDSFYECWDEAQFNYYVQNFGEITKRKALSMFRLEYDIQRDRCGYW